MRACASPTNLITAFMAGAAILSAASCLAADRARDIGVQFDGEPGPLNAISFYASLRERLSDTGLLSINLFNRSRRYDGTIARIDYAFAQRALAFASADKGNYIAFAAAGQPVDVSAAELRARAIALKAATGLDLRPTVNRLIDAKPANGDRLAI